MSATRHRTTVVDRIKALGFEPENRLDWAAGDAVRKEYEVATGELPRKALRGKTNGPGTHCHAVYPDWFVPRIDKIITEIAQMIHAADAKQQKLFDE